MMAAMKTGLEVLLHSRRKALRGLRLGLVAHQASVDSRLQNAVDLLRRAPGVHLVRVFGPQHGLYGQTQDNMIEWEGSTDPRTGLELVSLYGRHRQPTPQMLRGLDLLLFDLQDIGARYYTFISTLSYCMQACAENGVPLWVLDRPNPIGGEAVEGNVVDPAYTSFVGMHPLAVRHGMTVGELARLYQGEFGRNCDLTVVEMQGWRRRKWFDETGLPWMHPSPNMPTPATAEVYPGMCLLEATNISEGRGTTRPFELFGAPFLEPYAFAEELNGQRLPGVVFRPTQFIPTFHKFANEVCGGILIHVTDRQVFKPFWTGLAILAALRKSCSAFAWKAPPYEYEMVKRPIDILLGGEALRHQVEAGASWKEMEKSARRELARFQTLRRRYLIYR